MNYISGELKFLIPIHYGSVVEVKYNYKPTGESIHDTLTGGYYQYNFKKWPGSNMRIFYFDDMNEVTKEETDDIFFNPEETEFIHNHYYGSAINLQKGPATLSSEFAITDFCKEDTDYAGNLEFDYKTSKTKLNYLFTTATPDFTGVGVVPIVTGEKHQFTGEYKFDAQWSTDFNLTRVIKGEDFSKTINQTAESQLNYQLNDKHRFSISLDGNLSEEWGEVTTDLDYRVGWNYQITDKISFSLEDSLKRPESGRVFFQIKDKILKLKSEYNQYPKIIPYFGEYWVREWNTDMTYRPYNGVTLTTDIDYYQPFDASFEESQRRLALTLIASPNRTISTRSNYVYFFNPNIQSRTLFYDINSTFNLPYNIQLDGAAEKIEINSSAVINTDQEWHIGITYPLFKSLILSYQLEQDQQEVFLKDSDKLYQDTDALTSIYNINYQITDQFNIALSHSRLNSIWLLGTSITENEELKTSLALNYFNNLNKFEYQLEHQKKQNLNQLIHTLSWENKIGHLKYSYEGTLAQPLNNSKIFNQNQLLKANWDNPSIPYKPSIQIHYQSQDKEENKWRKYNISMRLGYKLSKNQEIFSELGHMDNVNYLDQNKDYRAIFIKLGVEYDF